MPPSVVVASCRDRQLLERLLDSLAPLCRRLGAEQVVARAGADQETRDLAARYPAVRFIPAPPGTGIPVLRGLGMEAATGDPVAVTEDHLLPAEDWLDRLMPALEEGVGAAGGGMANSAGLGPVGWAAYLADYGFFSTARRDAPGAVPLITAANVAYPRAVVARLAAWAKDGEWENVLHDRLRADGRRLRFVPEARVYHRQQYRFRAFWWDRYQHGLDYSRSRLAEHPDSPRWLLLLAAPALVPLLFLRITRASWREHPAAVLAAAPITLAFLTGWAVGEAVGYWRGPAVSPSPTQPTR